MRAITNHVLIGKYHLRFFPRESFKCSYGLNSVKSRQYVFHEYRRYNNYWNPNREFLKHFIAFLELIPEAFSFYKGIT